MIRNSLRSSVALPALLLVGVLSAAESAGSSVPRGKDYYEKQVLPVLQKFCYDCHGDGMDKGNVALDKHGDFAAAFADKKFWDNVREHVDTHVMPPEKKPQPSNEERAVIVKWIEDEVFWVDPSHPDPGHITLRRLNRSEYNNTVRDVFKVDSRPADNFPPDDTGYGYDNIGDVLSLSPLLMEKYLKEARKVADEAVWVKTTGRLARDKSAHEFQDIGDVSDRLADDVRSITKNGDIAAKFEVPASGVWRAELEVSAIQAGPEKVKLAVLVDGTEVRQFEVNADLKGSKGEKWERVRFDLPMKSGYRMVTVRFLNDFYDEKASDANHRDRNAFMRYFSFQGPLVFRTPDQSKLLDWLCDGKRIAPASLTLLGSDFDAGSSDVGVDDERICFASSGEAHRSIDIPADGTYTLRMTVGADQAGPELAKLRVSLGGTVVADAREITVKKSGATEEWTFHPTLKKGPCDFRVEFLNDFYDAKGKKDRNAYFNSATLEASGDRGSTVDRETLRAWIDAIGLKAMRRPLDEADRQKINTLADMVLQDGGSMVDALKLACEGMLVSSKFLFRGGATPSGAVENGAVPVDEFTLASRLSYFLWSSAPDDELLRLAQKGELRKNLPQQIARMIGDARAWALTENFAGQWLQLRDIELVSPDRRRYPEFSSKLASAMKKESQLYFDHIYRENCSVLEFLDSDYTFANDQLARYYGLPERVKSQEFEKVSLAGTARGGILTQGSILTLTSHPNRTSPVKRGKFLLENILGTPPPPPPQNVPAFREDRSARVQGTLRQRFEAHRANPSCASCHAFLDPMGFAFENYDAIGRWRDQDNGQSVDARGQLLTGQTFDGAQELRKVLVMERKDEFTRCLVENLLTYALGRGLDYPDKLFVRQIAGRAANNGYKFQGIVNDIIESVPFQRMRASSGKQLGAE